MIFCVEDDASIRDLMLYTLNAAGFDARGFETGTELFAEIEKNRPQLIMLDIMLPGEDGISILKRLRAAPHTASIPVIMATAKGSEYDRVIGLDLGADDYLSKPFGMMEMVARVRAVLRRGAPAADSGILAVSQLRLDKGAHLVSVAGEPVQLTLKEFELLQLFMENPGQVFTRDRLLSIVWGIDHIGETRTVDVHIATLRTKLGRAGSCIQTVRGVGYRLDSSI